MSEFHAPPDMCREEVWLRRKGARKNRRRRESVTDEDLDELKACIELGFGFDSPEVDRRLSDTLPALHLFYAVNSHYSESTPPPLGSPHSIFITGGKYTGDEGEAETMGTSGGVFGSTMLLPLISYLG